jgi:Flp pilus assembly protein TadD
MGPAVACARKNALDHERDVDEAAGHLIELGYVDPVLEAARKASLHREPDAELQQGAEHLSRGQTEQALPLLEKLAADDPRWIAPRQLLAETYYRAGRFADCQAALDWLAEHGVEQPRLSLLSGALALRRREFGAALDELEYACHVEPELPSAHTLRGQALLRLGQLDDAQAAFQTALEQRPADAIAYAGLAQIHGRRGDFEEAAACALAALEHNMQLFAAHYHLGIALLQLDRPQDAVTALETAARLDPNRAAPYYWLSRIAAEQLVDPALAANYRETGREIIRLHPKQRPRNSSGKNS